MAVAAPFGKRLKQAREQAGISQKCLGVLAGIEESNASAIMNQYERETHMPKFATVRNIASALNVATAYFYADEDELAELLLLYGSLNRNNQKAILADLRNLKQPGNYEEKYPAPPPTIHDK
jgi:transcriptional regulator with XRE-family HTH domain